MHEREKKLEEQWVYLSVTFQICCFWSFQEVRGEKALYKIYTLDLPLAHPLEEIYYHQQEVMYATETEQKCNFTHFFAIPCSVYCMVMPT